MKTHRIDKETETVKLEDEVRMDGFKSWLWLECEYCIVWEIETCLETWRKTRDFLEFYAKDWKAKAPSGEPVELNREQVETYLACMLSEEGF